MHRVLTHSQSTSFSTAYMAYQLIEEVLILLVMFCAVSSWLISGSSRCSVFPQCFKDHKCFWVEIFFFLKIFSHQVVSPEINLTLNRFHD